MTINPPKRNLQKRRPLYAYLRAGRLLHLITLLEITVLAVVAPGLLELRPESATDVIFKPLILAFLVSLPILSQLDARSRFQSYKRVKDALFIYGCDPRILRPVSRSRCQRDAAMAAAEELGYHRLCRRFHQAEGYRWYHILPDFVFSQPGFLVSRRFWRSTFFSKTYHARTEF